MMMTGQNLPVSARPYLGDTSDHALLNQIASLRNGYPLHRLALTTTASV
jgi:hypothetical protein